MKAVVTGGAGFIGHHLARGLVEQGHEVTIVDDLSTGLESRLRQLAGTCRSVRADIRDGEAMTQAFAGAEVVFHQAAIPSVARSMEDPRRSMAVNVTGTVEVMLAAAAAGVRRVLLAGSSSVYGPTGSEPRVETRAPDPRSPYAASKVAAEVALHTIGLAKGVETVVLRYFNIFGPGQDPASAYAAVVPLFTMAVLRGESPRIHGDGTQSRDFTYIDNVVAANLQAAVAPGASGSTLNIGCGGRFTLLELLDLIQRFAGRTVEPTFTAPRPGDLPWSQADISAARRAIGYEVKVPFEEGVERTVAWYQGVVSARASA